MTKPLTTAERAVIAQARERQREEGRKAKRAQYHRSYYWLNADARRAAKRKKTPETANGLNWASTGSTSVARTGQHGFQKLHCAVCGDQRAHRFGVCVSVERHGR